MDPKAAAKSKRSHTVHGRRVHQTPTAAAAHRQKRAAAAAAAASTGAAPRSRNLPSNWDRYDAEAEGDDPAPTAEWTGEVPPRSKGADFAFLLDQARAQPREARGLGAVAGAPWLTTQESPFDFMQASTSMLEAKGEGILSWCHDDNFILEDDLAPDFEVPFLSIDLHALAIKLSKLKLSQRLFIEEGLLPEDVADLSEENEILIQCGTSMENEDKDTRKNLGDHGYSSNLYSDDQMKTDRHLQSSEEKTTTLPKISSRLVHSESEDNSYTRIMGAVPDAGHSKGSKFEVAAAEELDMLLNSLDGIHLPSSKLGESFGNKQGMEVSKPNEQIASSTSSKSLGLAALDDALDDLLSETSLSVQNEGSTVSSLTSHSQPVSNSDHNDDFRYAKQIEVTCINDLADDVPTDDSSCLNDEKQTISAQTQDNISNVSAPPHSGPSNVDDFDSWFDSL